MHRNRPKWLTVPRTVWGETTPIARKMFLADLAKSSPNVIEVAYLSHETSPPSTCPDPNADEERTNET